MPEERDVLLAVDATEASERAARWTGRLLAGSEDGGVHILHVVGPVPPELMEHGGSEEPGREQALDEELDAARRRWVEEAERDARPLLDRIRRILTDAGVAAGRITTHVRPCHPGETVPDAVLEACGEQGSGTVVVGRGSFPWHERVFHQHVGREVVKRCEGLTVCIVAP